MDLYTDPAPQTYITWSLFNMPTNEGKSIRSIAVSSGAGNLFTSSYSVLLWLMFSVAWQLVLYIAIIIVPSMGNPNRHVLMVGFWNSGDPATAFVFMLHYAWTAFMNMKTETGKRDWRTFGWSCGLLFVSACGAFGVIASGIMVPAKMIVGHAAPAQPSEVFFASLPLPMNETASGRVRTQALRSTAAIRAIGSVEASKVTLRPRVTFVVSDYGTDGRDDSVSSYEYSYNVSGWDFGLQNYPGFQQVVTGVCTTEYPISGGGTVGVDKYFPWGKQREDQVIIVPKTAEEHDPPYAEIRVHPDIKRDDIINGKISFAIIPHTAGRHSYSSSGDLWYTTAQAKDLTEKDPTTYEAEKKIPTYRVEGGRPALSCWQNTSYKYKNSKVDSVFDLENLNGFDIPRAWNSYFTREFSLPMIVTLGQSLGRSILLSPTTYLDGTFDAESSTIRNDIERLVLGAFVASRDIFRDSTMVSQAGRIRNEAREKNSRPQARVGEFVLATGAVVTLRLDILVAIPAVLGFLGVVYIALLTNSCIYESGGVSNRGVRSRISARRSAFQATQLYRYMDEHVVAEEGITVGEPAGICYSSPNKRWEGRTARIPYVHKLEASGATHDVGLFKVSNSLHAKVVPDTAQDISSGTPRVELALTRAWLPGIDHHIQWTKMNDLVRNGESAGSGAYYTHGSGAGIDHTQNAGTGTNQMQAAAAGADYSQTAGTGANPTVPATAAVSGANYTLGSGAGIDHTQSAGAGTNQTQAAAAGADYSQTAGAGANLTLPATAAVSGASYTQGSGAGIDHTQNAGAGTNQTQAAAAGADNSQTAGVGANPTLQATAAGSGANRTQCSSARIDHTQNAGAGTNQTQASGAGANPTLPATAAGSGANYPHGVDQTQNAGAETNHTQTTGAEADLTPPAAVAPPEEPSEG